MNRYGVSRATCPRSRAWWAHATIFPHVYLMSNTIRVLRNVRASFADAATSREFAHAHELWARLQAGTAARGAVPTTCQGRRRSFGAGEADAREFCTRLPAAGRHPVVCWHVLASAHRADCAAPGHHRSGTSHCFAAHVGEWERLNYLYLLTTAADIAGTSTKLWNSWRDRLLADCT